MCRDSVEEGPEWIKYYTGGDLSGDEGCTAEDSRLNKDRDTGQGEVCGQGEVRGYKGGGAEGTRLAPGPLVWVPNAALAEMGNPSREESVFILLGFRVRHNDK